MILRVEEKFFTQLLNQRRKDMKIAVASDDQKKISSHFGRSKGFAIFEIENNKIKDREYRLNTFTGHAMGFCQNEKNSHSSHHSSIINALSDCKVIISNGMGWRIHQDLYRNNMQALVTSEIDVEKAVALFLEGKLGDEIERLH